MKRRFLVFCLTLITLASFYSGAFSRIDPKAKNYYHKGLESFKKTNYAEALINFSSAISLYPQYEMAFLNRAYTQEKLGNSFQAIADYSEVIKINAKNKDAYYHRGHLNSRIGLDDEAIKDYTKTIGLDGKNYKAYYERGFIYNIMGLYQEALKDFEKCSQLKHGAEIDYITGIIESKLGNEEKAIVFFTNALKIDKNNINYYYHRADSKIKLGKYAEAMQDLTIANSMDTAKVDAYIYHSMGVAQHYLRNYNEALIDFNKAIELNPIVNDFYYHRANTLMNLKMYDKAIADFSMVIELDPQGSLDSYINRAVAYTLIGKYAEAEEDYSKYIESNPYNFFIYQKRADVRVSMKDMEGALSDLNMLIQLKPENASAYYNRGIIEINLDKKEAACKDFKKSGELGNIEVSEVVKKSCE